MRKVNKIAAIFVVMFVFAFGVFAADYASQPDGYESTKYAITDVVVSSITNQGYTGKAITPSVTVKHNDVTLVEGTHYTVIYTNNIKIGTAKVKVEGIGSYEGTKEVSFKILKNIASTKVTGVVTKTYTGSKQTQSLKVKYGSTTLKNGKDYTLSYSNNVNAGTATITITGKGNYAGTKTLTFKVARRSIAKLTYSKVSNYTYTGKAITPNVTVKYGKRVLVKDTDYTVTYSKNVNSGTATITVTGKGNFAGTKKITFSIKDRSIASAEIVGLKSRTYTGAKQYQSLTLTYNGMTLVKDTHYTMSYKNNINAGVASVTITGKGNFNGSKTLKFKIWDRNINDLEIAAAKSLIYTGNPRNPSVTVKYGSKILKKNTDYKVEYSNNVNVGTGKITVTGIGNYTGTKILTYEITKRDIASVSVNGLEEKMYTGGKLTQSLKLTYAGNTLKNGIHYTLTYANNVNAGTASVTVTGIGNFYGEKTLTYKIARRSVSKLTYSKVSNYTYTGEAITPSVTIKYGKMTLVKDTDYTVTYTNNVNAGTATIVVKGKGNFAGTKKITFSINRRSVNSVTIEGLKSKIYTGSKQYQSLTLTYNEMILKNGTDYTLSYKNNIAIGTASVTVTGKGNYSGSKTLNFKINPPSTKLSSAIVKDNNVKVVWSKVSSATGYDIYMSKDGGEYTKLTTITNNSTINYTAKNLADGEYSFKVRAYKTVGKTKYYSGYSDTQTASIVTITVPVPTIKFDEQVTGPDGSVQYTLVLENTSELDGVEVYYKTSEKGEYKLQREYSKTDFTAYDIAVEIPKNGHYYFKVRGYKEVDGKKYYSGYSNVIDYKNIEPEVKTVDYIVGKNIEAGTYKVVPTIATKPAELSEYIPSEIYENMGPGMGFGISSLITTSGYFTLRENDEGITITNGTIEKVDLSKIPINIKTSVSNGMYLVGKDIEPGTYKVTTQAQYATVYIMESIVLSDWNWSEGYFQNGYIKVTEDISAVNIVDGTIEKVDLDNYPVNIKDSVSNGTFFVGKDITPGTYRVTKTQNLEDVWDNIRIWSEDDTYGEYINMNKGYIEITESATMINLISTTLEKVNLKDMPANIQTTISEDGVYLVGKDIAPGIYKYALRDGAKEHYDVNIIKYSDLLFNYESETSYTNNEYGYFEVKDTDVAIRIEKVTATKQDYKDAPVNIKTKVSDGVYIVGKDIAPGTYKVTATGNFAAYVSKTTEAYVENFSWDEITGGVETKAGYIEIKSTDYFVTVTGGIIEYVDLDKMPVNIKNKVGAGTYIVGKDITPGTYKLTSNKYSSVTLLDSLDGVYNEQDKHLYIEQGIAYIDIDDSIVAVEVYGYDQVTLEKININDIPTNIKTTVSDGTHIVGKDIVPGTYKIDAASNSTNCSVVKYSSVNMLEDNMVQNIYLKRGYIEVTEQDKVVKIHKGILTKVNVDNIETNPQTSVESLKYESMYLVGKEVAPGTYKIIAKDEYCTVETYSKLDMNYEYQTNYFSGKAGYIEIKDTDCIVLVQYAQIEKIEDEEPEIKDSVSDGMYIVGKDILPGLYSVTGAENMDCWVYKYSDISTDWENQTGYYGGAKGYIEIYETDVSVKVQGGTITRIDLETMPKDYLDTVSDGMYLVGKEVAPGLYKIDSGDLDLYHTIYTYSKITTEYDYRTNYFSGNYGYIEIKDTDVIVTVDGIMTRVYQDELQENIRPTLDKGGMYLVGVDMTPGVYKVIANDSDSAWIEVYSQITSDDYDYYITGNSEGTGYMEILDTDVSVVVRDGMLQKIELDELPTNIKDTVSNGMYLVGKDIVPGIYQVGEYTSAFTYSSETSSLRNLTQTASISTDYGYIEVLDTDFVVEVNGTMKRVDLDNATPNYKETITNGMYLVGKDIEPGVYKVISDDYNSNEEYRWMGDIRTFSCVNTNEVAENYWFYAMYGYIEIKDTDVLVTVDNATMQKVNLDELPQDIQPATQTGIYIVGKDILPGTYMITGDSWGCVNKLSSISTNDIVGATYNNGESIVITAEDYAVHVYSSELTEVEQTEVAVKKQIKQQETPEIQQGAPNQEVSIYNEVNIYSENK